MALASRLLVVLLTIVSGSVSVSVYAAEEPVLLRVIGLDEVVHEVRMRDISDLTRASIKAVDHGGGEVAFEGVPARELLRIAGTPLEGDLRGENLSIYVTAEGSDGYKVVYALAEFDSGFTDAVILVADHRNGQSLAADEGPLRIVVPWEKRQGRWVRQLITLRLTRVL